MGTAFRNLATLACFLLLLTALIASASKTIDRWIVILVWSAFLLGSVILIIKNARLPENRGLYFGQLALLPRSWQRWILGEQKPQRTR